MITLKTQLDDLRTKAEKDITSILQEFVSKTGYVPNIINVNVVDVSSVGDYEKQFIVSNIDLAYGK